jgi:hypothetical protein
MTAWRWFARILFLATFAQSFFAGVFLSGDAWGRDAHRTMAETLVAVTLLAGIVALVALRNVSGGLRFGGSLLAFGVALAIQMAIGLMATDGERVLWLHIPFGVALIGAAGSLEAAARSLGEYAVSHDPRERVA